INADIPILGFYMVAPVLLFGFYLYLHLYLQRLWVALAALPAVFPDGKTLGAKTCPWVLDEFVAACLPRLEHHRSPLAALQQWLTVLLAWGSVPLILVLVWLRYLSARDEAGTLWHVACLAATVGAGIAFYALATTTLRGDRPPPFRRNGRIWTALLTTATLALGVGLGTLSGWAMRRASAGKFSARARSLLGYLGYHPFLDLRD